MKLLLSALALAFSINSFAQLPPFIPAEQPAAPEYSKPENWAALPFRADAADFIPKGETPVSDSIKKADVFYIYPTIYKNGNTWLEDLTDEKLNKRIDKLPIRYQASVFNQYARVYAPRYRQAIINVFYSDSTTRETVLDAAYQDVKRAFEYYLKNYNNGRPIIIASHSQGTHHARRLLAEYFDNKALYQKLIAAYVVGYSVQESRYKSLRLCNDSTETGCYVTWLSYTKDFYPRDFLSKNAVSVNPVSWKRDTLWTTFSEHKGAILKNINRNLPATNSARIKGGILWVDSKIALVRMYKNLHIGDYNLFWHDIRYNAGVRINSYLKKNP